MDFDTLFRETRSGRNVRQIIILPDLDVSEPDTVSEDELDRTFQQSHTSSDNEVIEEDDASANARRKSYIWRRRPFNPKTEAFIEIPRMDTVANCMSHNRFETLLRFLHFSDNDKVVMDRSHPDYDRFYKIRPLIESIRKTCLEETAGELQRCGKNGFVHDFWLCDGMAPKVENLVDFFAADVVMKGCETLPKHKGFTAEVAQSQATHGICKSTLASRQVELVRRTKGCEWFSTW
ncbi:hypothetical protein T07_1546 [Trichinella nelsoni]|uniref:PiggyBac transposable element-derived protein domain-containing protein n=1 Tax=Trichinella nelsoni TaxID=6336 RepID=A0A0V0SN74_9BILA|nr:hypothetical protein T07_1546 [Trichinella nelsoni]